MFIILKNFQLFILFVIILLCPYCDANEEDLTTLRMTSILFRHGDKSPTDTYPKDPYINYEWPGGKGALSEKGTLQLYKLGEIFRKRYQHLLPEDGIYSKNDIFVLSSYAERCIMSAQSLLAGFMPPLESNNILPINWQPIAVNSIPRNMDYLIAQAKPCHKYDNILKNLYINPPPDLKEINEENRDLYRLLTKHTGKNISTILDVELLYNTLEIEKSNGLVLPDWTENIFPERMLPLTERSYTLFTETAFMKKVKGGGFITEVFDNMLAKKSGKLKPDRKIFFYAGHDVTLVNVMNSLEILDQTSRKPDYASALVFELHNVSNEWEVRILYYYNSEAQRAKHVNITNCGDPCSLTQFKEAIRNLLLNDFDGVCENVEASSNLC